MALRAERRRSLMVPLMVVMALLKFVNARVVAVEPTNTSSILNKVETRKSNIHEHSAERANATESIFGENNTEIIDNTDSTDITESTIGKNNTEIIDITDSTDITESTIGKNNTEIIDITESTIGENNTEIIVTTKLKIGENITEIIDTTESTIGKSNAGKRITDQEETGLEVDYAQTYRNMPVGEDTLTVTCRGLCGAYATLPCSCSKVCVLYDTCCENFTQDCPTVYELGRRLYADYFTAKLTCDKESVSTIASCPFDNAINVTATRPLVRLRATSTEVQSYLLQSPVTDSISGLTFLNQEIYDCYRRSLNLTSKVKDWSFRLETYISDYVDFEIEPLYHPNFDPDDLAPHLCLFFTDAEKVVYSCEEGAHSYSVVIEGFNYYSKRCGEFTMFVVSKLTNIVYRNQYCAYCYEGRHSYFAYVPRKNPSKSRGGFNLLMKISGVGKYIVDAGLSQSHLRPAWTVIECSRTSDIIGKEDDETGNVISKEGIMSAINSNMVKTSTNGIVPTCQAIECNGPTFTLRPDGLCKADYHMLVAFRDNEIGMPPLSCPNAAEKIGEFISCSLDLSLQGGAWDHVSQFFTPEITVGVEDSSGSTIYFVELFFVTAVKHGEAGRFTFYEDDQALNIERLSAAVRAYHFFRGRNTICDTRHEYYQSQEMRNKMVDPSDIIAVDAYAKSYENQVKRMSAAHRGEVIDTENTTFLCLSHIRPVSMELDVFCFEDYLYADHVAEADDLLKSPCVDHLQKLLLKTAGGGNILPRVCNLHLGLFCLAYVVIASYVH